MSAIEGTNPHAAIAAALQAARHGHKAGEDETGAAPAGQAGETAAETPSVQITLSDDAQEFLDGDRRGKSAHSTAHRARAALDLEEFASLRDLPFGRIVSTLARFGDLSSLLPPADEDDGGADDGGAVVDPDATPPVDGEAPVDGDGTTAALGDGTAVDTTTAVIGDAEVALSILEQIDELEDAKEADDADELEIEAAEEDEADD